MDEPEGYYSEKFLFHLLGESSDGYTNKWRVTCARCGKSHVPHTTMYAWQTIECPKCGETENINYNELNIAP